MLSHSPDSGFTVDPEIGLLAPARQCASRNCDDRPPGATLDMIVVHGISLPPGEFGGDFIPAFFCNQLDTQADPYFAEISGLQVSAHVLIDRAGVATQFVPFVKRAWHAGVSSWQGRERCNDFSIGIELEGTDDTAYTPAQYEVLNAMVVALRFAYPSLTEAPIVGHSDIAPGRKTDPGDAFDWSLVHRSSSQS